MIGDALEIRFKLLGIRPCGKCLDIKAELNSKSPEYVLKHSAGIAMAIDQNVCDIGWRGIVARLIPGAIRRDWIERQLVIVATRVRRDARAH